MGELAALLARDPLRVAAARGDLAVERHRRLEQHPRPPRAGVLAERLVEQTGPDRQLAVGDHYLDALVAEDAETAAGGVLAGVVRGDDKPPDPGLPDRVGARRRATVVAARLERHVQGGAAQIASLGSADRLDLGVRLSDRLVIALAEHLAVAADDRADERVRTDAPAATLGQFDRASEVAAIDVGGAGHGGALEDRTLYRGRVRVWWEGVPWPIGTSAAGIARELAAAFVRGPDRYRVVTSLEGYRAPSCRNARLNRSPALAYEAHHPEFPVSTRRTSFRTR